MNTHYCFPQTLEPDPSTGMSKGVRSHQVKHYEEFMAFRSISGNDIQYILVQ